MKTAFVFAALLVLAGCAGAPSVMPDSSRRADPDPMQVKADKEVFGLRVDVYRNESVGIQIASNTVQVSDPSNYALTGVDAGNGLFVDTNGNLAVDLARLYQITPPFHIEETVAGLFPYKISYLFQGKTFKRSGGGSDLPDQVATYRGDEVDVSTKSYLGSTDGSIYSDSDGLVYNLSGLHLTGRVVLKQVSPNRVELGGLVGNSSYVLRNAYEADLTSKFNLAVYDNVLRITLGGSLLGKGTTYNFVRTLEGCWFSDAKGNTHEISLKDGTITVRKNGSVERTYKILPTD
jgi:hypothetical protein